MSTRFPLIPEVLWLTTFALVVAQLPIIKRLRGAAVVSYFALHIFFIVLGSASVLAEVVEAGMPIFSLMIAIILLHMLVAYGLGWLARLDLATVSVASQAAIGGPGSALALSMAMKWEHPDNAGCHCRNLRLRAGQLPRFRMRLPGGGTDVRESLEGTDAVVTGAGRGLGRAIARAPWRPRARGSGRWITPTKSWTRPSP